MKGYFTNDIASYTREQCEDYLKKFHDESEFSQNVRQRLVAINNAKQKIDSERLRMVELDEKCWEISKKSLSGIQIYKATYPYGLHIGECDLRMEKLKTRKIRRLKVAGVLFYLLAATSFCLTLYSSCVLDNDIFLWTIWPIVMLFIMGSGFYAGPCTLTASISWTRTDSGWNPATGRRSMR